MAGFEELPGGQQPVIVSEIPADKVTWPGQTPDDDIALQMVLADTQRAESYVQSKALVADWERADNNFRAASLPKNWANGTPRAGLSMPVVMEVVEKLTALVFLAFFSDPQPFLLEGIGAVNADALRAKEKLLLWATQLSDFQEEMRKSIKSAILYGYCVARWGWKRSTISRTEYQIDTTNTTQPVKVKPLKKDYEIAHPTVENIELRKVLIDPALREQDCRKARFAVLQCFVDSTWLDDHRSDSEYQSIPTRDQLAFIMAQNAEPAADSLIGSKNITFRDNQAAPENEKQSIDPLKAPLELLEYITADRVITILNRKIVIRNEQSEFGRSSLLSCAFIDVPGAMYGFGVSKLLAGEQYLQTSVMAAWLDALVLQLNPAFTSEQGLQTTSQNVTISAGKILTGTDLKPIPIPDVGPAAVNAVQNSEARATKRVGANTADNMPTQALRTSAGVNAFTEGATDKLQYFIENFARLVFIPTLEAFLDICHNKLQPADIQQILSEQAGQAYEGNILDVYNTRCRIQILSSTKLTQRRSSSQLIPLFLQLAQAAPVQQALAAQNQKFGFGSLLKKAIELGGLDWDDLIQPASPQEVQNMMQMSAPQMVKAQVDAQSKKDLATQQQQDVLEQIQEKGFTAAGVAIVKHSVEAAGKEATGEPL